jgi:rod shape-determining protein MreD
MAILLGIPILVGLIMLQTAVVSTLPLLHGTADLILLVVIAWAMQERVPSSYEWAVMAGLMIGAITAAPFYVPLVGYAAAVTIARLLRGRVWQTPLLAMLLTVFIASLLMHGMTWVVLRVQGTPLPVIDSLNQVVLPATLLNLLLAIPVYALVTDLAKSIYPEEVNI